MNDIFRKTLASSFSTHVFEKISIHKHNSIKSITKWTNSAQAHISPHSHGDDKIDKFKQCLIPWQRWSLVIYDIFQSQNENEIKHENINIST